MLVQRLILIFDVESNINAKLTMAKDIINEGFKYQIQQAMQTNVRFDTRTNIIK